MHWSLSEADDSADDNTSVFHEVAADVKEAKWLQSEKFPSTD